MKTAVIYYSFEGNSTAVASLLAEKLKADIFHVELKDAKKRKGFSKYAWGGGMVFMHKTPPIKPLSINIDAYDLIILGFPVWAAAPAPPLVSFLNGIKLSGKKVALYCCHGGGKGAALEKLKALIPGNTIAGEIDFKNPGGADKNVLSAQLDEWIKTIKP
jgi:flavodoxin